MAEQYTFDLNSAQLKASSNTSALLSGFATIALVELIYESETPRWLLIMLGAVTAILISVHLLALMMSTCIQPYMQASKELKGSPDSPEIRLKFYIDLSWSLSTCIGLILFLVDFGVICYFQFCVIGFEQAGWIASAILVAILFVFITISWSINRLRAAHSLERIETKASSLKAMISVSEHSLPMMKMV